MRVDRMHGRAPFDNMQARPLRGTHAWAEHAVVLAVPEDATSIRLGILQDGPGRTWIDDARFEPVADDVPVTTADARPVTLADGGFERGDLGQAGWFMSGGAREQFAPSIDRVAPHGGAASARITAIVPAPKGYGVLMHAMRAEHVRGQRLRLRAWVRGESITGRGDFWARVQAADSPGDGPGLGYGACKLSGTFAYRMCEMVLDVGARADAIELGLGLGGPGTAWVDDVTLEPVDAATPLAVWKPTPSTLENGDFERAGDTPSGWMISGFAHASYEAVIDRGERHGGAASVRLAPKAGVQPKGYGTLLQGVDAALYRGKRLRVTAWSKGEGVTARGDVWMRVQAAGSPADGPGLGGGRCALRGTFDWLPCSVVFDVPREAAWVQIGSGIDGPGRLWLDDVTFEEVDASVPVTDPSRAVPPKAARPDAAAPIDLDFERVDTTP
ncbi:Transcriptional regulator, AraC family protein [Minicystis rosea]|nr:Transcriptional regulator, AraC family protein [Minicystis rosea]